MSGNIIINEGLDTEVSLPFTNITENAASETNTLNVELVESSFSGTEVDYSGLTALEVETLAISTTDNVDIPVAGQYTQIKNVQSNYVGSSGSLRINVILN